MYAVVSLFFYLFLLEETPLKAPRAPGRLTGT